MTGDEIRELAAKVAAELGAVLEPPDPDSCDQWAYITDGSVRLFLEAERAPGRVRIHGSYPRRTGYGFRPGERPEITVAVDRGAQAIAREIERRLLPAWTETLGKIRAWDKQEAAEQATRAQLAARMSALFPEEAARLIPHMQSDYHTTVLVSLPDLGGGEVKFHGGASEVTLERFRVPAETAVRMLAEAAREPGTPATAADMRASLSVKAETYAQDARKLRDAVKLGRDNGNPQECEHLARLYLAIAEELRKIAQSA